MSRQDPSPLPTPPREPAESMLWGFVITVGLVILIVGWIATAVR